MNRVERESTVRISGVIWGPFDAQNATWKANVVFWRFETTQTTIADGSKRMPRAGCTIGGDDRE